MFESPDRHELCGGLCAVEPHLVEHFKKGDRWRVGALQFPNTMSVRELNIEAVAAVAQSDTRGKIPEEIGPLRSWRSGVPSETSYGCRQCRRHMRSCWHKDILLLEYCGCIIVLLLFYGELLGVIFTCGPCIVPRLA